MYFIKIVTECIDEFFKTGQPKHNGNELCGACESEGCIDCISTIVNEKYNRAVPQNCYWIFEGLL